VIKEGDKTPERWQVRKKKIYPPQVDGIKLNEKNGISPKKFRRRAVRLEGSSPRYRLGKWVCFPPTKSQIEREGKFSSI